MKKYICKMGFTTSIMNLLSSSQTAKVGGPHVIIDQGVVVSGAERLEATDLTKITISEVVRDVQPIIDSMYAIRPKSPDPVFIFTDPPVYEKGSVYDQLKNGCTDTRAEEKLMDVMDEHYMRERCKEFRSIADAYERKQDALRKVKKLNEQFYNGPTDIPENKHNEHNG